VPTLTVCCKEVRARARLDFDFYMATQAGWSERAVTKTVETYARAVDERRLDEIDAAFQERLPTPSGVLLVGKAAHVSERETLT
jgi:hypothetical protein